MNFAHLANRIGILILALLTITSCSDENSSPQGEAGQAIVFTANPSAPLGHLPSTEGRSAVLGSRAAGNTWHASDRIGIYMLAAVTTGSSETLEQRLATIGVTPNHLYTTTNTAAAEKATLTTANPFYFPVDRRAVNFIAYYPYAEAVSNETNQHTYPVNVSTTAGTAQVLKDIDLLYHTDGLDSDDNPVAYQLGAANVPLSFSHQLSKVVIRITRNSNEALHPGFDAGASVSISGVPTTATFNLATGTLSGLGGADKTITPALVGTTTTTAASWEAIVVPHVATGYTSRSFTFTFAEGMPQEVCPMPATRNLEAGKVHYFDFQLTSKGVTLVGNTIANWNEDPNAVKPYMLKASEPAAFLNCEGDRTDPNKLYTILTTATESELTLVTSLDPNYETAEKPEWLQINRDQNTVIENGWKRYEIFPYSEEYYGGIDPRTGYILAQVEGMTIPIEVKQEGPGHTSNCYLLKPGETVYIPVRRANEYAAEMIDTDYTPIGDDEALGIEVLWEDTDGMLSSYMLLGSGSSAAISITVNEMIKSGNASIGVRGQDGLLKWSWHIWVPETEIVTNQYGWMDRNLGATTSTPNAVTTLGLQYQWGRKDPFPGSANLADWEEPSWWSYVEIDGEFRSFNYFIDKPKVISTSWISRTRDKELWSPTHKTLYDPCPEGYQVPASEDWSTVGWSNDIVAKRGFTHPEYGGYYPAAGWRGYYDNNFVGALVGREGYYWTSNKCSTTEAYGLVFTRDYLNPGYEFPLDQAYPVRCKRIAN